MNIYSAPLSLLLFLVFHCQCPGALPGDICRINHYDDREIKQVVNEAVHYNGWVSDPDFREKLGRMYDGAMLACIINSVEQFRNERTDWHTLTFMQKCHIVYSDGNKALVLALLEETDPGGNVSGRGTGAFTLHKKPGGWRITRMQIKWALME